MTQFTIRRTPTSLDERIARDVMGLNVVAGGFVETKLPEQDGWFQTNRYRVPSYSTTIEDVWTILPKFIDFKIESENWVAGEWKVRLWKLVNNDRTQMGEATVHRFEEIPLAICQAALRAIQA